MKKLYLAIFVTILPFIYSIDYEFLNNNNFRKYERTKFCYEILAEKKILIKKEKRKEFIELASKSRDYKLFTDSIYHFFMKDQLDKRYEIPSSKTETFLAELKNDMTRSKYFKRKYKTWDDSSFVMYIAFRTEYFFLQRYFSKFNLEDFKKNSAYITLKELLLKDSISINSADSVLNLTKKMDYAPHHFYYKPNSVKEQWKADKVDIKTLDFKEIMDFEQKYMKTLKKAEKKYKVNKEIIVAILKRETNLGRVPLTHNLFEVLLPQASFNISNPIFGKDAKKTELRRTKWIRHSAIRSLKNAIKYCIKEKINPSSIKSNFVGAVGAPQFMPFNFSIARDGDGDGCADLENLDDAIMSIANYFHINGYKKIYKLNKKNEKTLVKHILRYNSNPSYATTVYDIACYMKKLDKRNKKIAKKSKIKKKK